MQWVHDYQLFLFDFDGLLVNTEELHYLAYKRLCANRGFTLNWSFDLYCQHAHYKSDALGKAIYAEFPELLAIEPNWKILYTEKQQAIVDLLNEGAVHLMPGVSRLLEILDKSKISHCVVTHSPDELVNVVRQKNPILNTIPHWFTRHSYSQPKPDPECYLMAIGQLAKDTDRVIGFEDTPRGLQALLGTRAKPVLVCQAQYPEISAFIEQGASHFPSFDRIPDNWSG